MANTFNPFLRSIIAGNPVVYHATILVHSLTFITEIPVQKICFTFTLISGKETSKHLHKLCTGNAIGLDIPARFIKMVQHRLQLQSPISSIFLYILALFRMIIKPLEFYHFTKKMTLIRVSIAQYKKSENYGL